MHPQRCGRRALVAAAPGERVEDRLLLQLLDGRAHVLADRSRLDGVDASTGARRVRAIEIRLAPYRNDPARPRYERFAETTYTFTLSNDVPGAVVERLLSVELKTGMSSAFLVAAEGSLLNAATTLDPLTAVAVTSDPVPEAASDEEGKPNPMSASVKSPLVLPTAPNPLVAVTAADSV